MAEPSLEEYKKQRMAEIAAKLRTARTPKIDYTTGAPANVRALVGSAQTPRDRLETLKKFYPDAQPTPVDPENFVFTNPETGQQTLYNPHGMDTGDSPSLVREVVGQMGGAAAGAAYGSRGGPAGAFAGGMLGALGGDEAVTLAGRALGMEDTRTGTDRLQDAATLAAGEGLGHMGGAALTKGVTSLAKGVFRGGETGRRGVQQSIEDASRFDSFPSVAQATQKSYLDSIESTLSKVPGGAGHIRSAVKQTTEKVAKQLEGKIQALTGRAEVDPEIAGRAVIRGVGEMPSGTKPGTGFLGRFGETKSALYAKADGFIPDSTLVTPLNTRAALNELGNVVEDLPELNEWLVSKGIKGLAGAFPAQGPINYETLRRIRTAVGNKLTNFDLVSDVSRADWKRLYGSLSEDLKLAAQNAGPGATQAMNRADSYYKAGIRRVDDVLEPLVKKRVPEMISAALNRSVEKGGSTIRTVMRSLSPEERQVVSGSIIKNLGAARPGQQGAGGEAFSFETFLTNWNKLDPKAKESLFDWPGMKGMKEDLEALARWSEGTRESSRAFANPSGTAGSAGAVISTLSVGSGVTGLATGSTEMLAFPAVMAVSALGANAGARLMTSKPFVRWLAQSTKIKPSGWGAHIGRLAGVAAASQGPGIQPAIIDFMTALNQGEANGN
jgi:hypothetical protein